MESFQAFVTRTEVQEKALKAIIQSGSLEKVGSRNEAVVVVDEASPIEVLDVEQVSMEILDRASVESLRETRGVPEVVNTRAVYGHTSQVGISATVHEQGLGGIRIVELPLMVKIPMGPDAGLFVEDPSLLEYLAELEKQDFETENLIPISIFTANYSCVANDALMDEDEKTEDNVEAELEAFIPEYPGLEETVVDQHHPFKTVMKMRRADLQVDGVAPKKEPELRDRSICNIHLYDPRMAKAPWVIIKNGTAGHMFFGSHSHDRSLEIVASWRKEALERQLLWPRTDPDRTGHEVYVSMLSPIAVLALKSNEIFDGPVAYSKDLYLRCSERRDLLLRLPVKNARMAIEQLVDVNRRLIHQVPKSQLGLRINRNKDKEDEYVPCDVVVKARFKFAVLKRWRPDISVNPPVYPVSARGMLSKRTVLIPLGVQGNGKKNKVDVLCAGNKTFHEIRQKVFKELYQEEFGRKLESTCADSIFNFTQ